MATVDPKEFFKISGLILSTPDYENFKLRCIVCYKNQNKSCTFSCLESFRIHMLKYHRKIVGTTFKNGNSLEQQRNSIPDPLEIKKCEGSETETPPNTAGFVKEREMADSFVIKEEDLDLTSINIETLCEENESATVERAVKETKDLKSASGDNFQSTARATNMKTIVSAETAFGIEAIDNQMETHYPENHVNNFVCNNNFPSNSPPNLLANKIDGLEKFIRNDLFAKIERMQNQFNEMKASYEMVLKKLSNGKEVQTEVDESNDEAQYEFSILRDADELYELEVKLYDTKYYDWLIKHLSTICGTGGNLDGKNSAYRLVDYVFSRQLMSKCSLLGRSKEGDTNCGIKKHTNVYNLFFAVVRRADETFTMKKQDEFFENVLKNKKARLAAVLASGGHVTKVSKRKQRPKNLIYKKKYFNDQMNNLHYE